MAKAKGGSSNPQKVSFGKKTIPILRIQGPINANTYNIK